MLRGLAVNIIRLGHHLFNKSDQLHFYDKWANLAFAQNTTNKLISYYCPGVPDLLDQCYRLHLILPSFLSTCIVIKVKACEGCHNYCVFETKTMWHTHKM